MAPARSVSYRDLRFEKIPVPGESSRGSPYTRWVDIGMPAIPQPFLNCAFYLYRNEADALAGANTGGTGFFLALPTDDHLGHHYGVTNWHVAVRDGFSCVRINTANGPEVFEFGPEDWIFEPGKDDVAIVPLDIRQESQIAMFVGAQLVMTPDIAIDEKIGPGDEVFMLGRFVDLDAKETNIPAARFGNISTLPVPIKQPTGYEDGRSFIIDMHSRTGYSGSPVFVYRTPGNTLDWILKGGPINLGGGMFRLLGIHWGQFPEELPVVKRRKKGKTESISNQLHEEYIEGMSGMTCVIPSWRIMALLLSDHFVNQRKQVEEMRAKNSTPRPSEPKAESAADAKDVARVRDKMLASMLATPASPRSPRGKKRVKST